jgi:hypothetical protein
MDLHHHLMRVQSHQLYLDLENLMLKLSFHLTDVLKFTKTVDQVNFGESLNRILLLATARVLKIKWGEWTRCFELNSF